MDANLIEALNERVARLEAENRRIRLGAAIVAIVVAAAGIIASNGGRPARQIEAERFVVKDASGVVRATFGATRNGPELALRDASGQDQLVLRASEDSSSTLEVFQAGRLQASFGGSGGGPSLQLFDERGRIAASLYAWPGRSTGLALNRAQGGLDLGVEGDGAARFLFADPEGTVRGGWTFANDGRRLALQAPRERGHSSAENVRSVGVRGEGMTRVEPSLPAGGSLLPASLGGIRALAP